MGIGTEIGFDLDGFIGNDPIGEPRGFVREDGVCVVLFQTQTHGLTTPATYGGWFGKWHPCEDCGRMIQVARYTVTATCPDCGQERGGQTEPVGMRSCDECGDTFAFGQGVPKTISRENGDDRTVLVCAACAGKPK